MSLIHDIVKMQLVKAGYLPNYPYHMISDSEMCDAFLHTSTDNNEGVQLIGYFSDMYPCLSDDLKQAYDALVDDILLHLNKLKLSSKDSYVLPDWIYSYMLGVVVGPYSNSSDIHDLLVLLNLDNIEDTFTAEAGKACFKISKAWLKKPLQDSETRYPTIFGEPHVLKSLRVSRVNT